MSDWKFLESDTDGKVWLRNAAELHAFILLRDSRSNSRDEWYQIMVVTVKWLATQLDQIEGPDGRAIFAPMLVVSGSSSSEILASIDAAVALGGLAKFGTRIIERQE